MTSKNLMLDELKKILPQIANNAVEAEKLRQAPAENIKLLKSINLHRSLQPKKYGGLELPLTHVTDCMAALAGACAGTAWAFCLLITHSHQLAMYSEKLQDDVWSDDPNATASSSIAPFGQVEETEGGVIFNGDMKWSSGCDHAEWAILGFLRNNSNTGGKDYSFAVIPREDYEIVDDWYSAGMKPSGTKTLKIKKDTFVPEHRIELAKAMMTGESSGYGLYPDSKIFYAPYRPWFASGFAAMSLGIAERMLIVFTEMTRNRSRAYTMAATGKEIPALMRLAESTHQVSAARALLEKTWGEHESFAAEKLYPNDEKLAFWRTNQAYAIKMCCEAVNRLFQVSGGTSWVNDNEIQRLWRDVNMTAAHAYTDYDVCKQILGRSLMGMEQDATLA